MSSTCSLGSRNNTKLGKVVKNKRDDFTPHITKFTDVDKSFIKLGEERLVFSSLHGTVALNPSQILVMYLLTGNRMLPSSSTHRGLSDICFLLL